MSKKPNPYAWLTALAMEKFRLEQEAAKKPRLTLITGNERTCSMSTPTDQAPTATPLRNHGAFDDMGTAINLLALGADALKGIGARASALGMHNGGNQVDCVKFRQKPMNFVALKSRNLESARNQHSFLASFVGFVPGIG